MGPRTWHPQLHSSVATIYTHQPLHSSITSVGFLLELWKWYCSTAVVSWQQPHRKHRLVASNAPQLENDQQCHTTDVVWA